MHGVVRGIMIAGICTALGCSGGVKKVETHPVTGSVTKGGKPLAKVTVTLVPTEKTANTSCSGLTGDDGSFNIVMATGQIGAPAGSYKVILSNPVKNDVTSDKPWEQAQGRYQNQAAKGGKGSAPPSAVETTNDIPKEYLDGSSTPLKVTVPQSEPMQIQIP